MACTTKEEAEKSIRRQSNKELYNILTILWVLKHDEEGRNRLESICHDELNKRYHGTHFGTSILERID